MKLRVPPSEKNFEGIKTPLRVTPREQIEYISITLSETLRIAYKALVTRFRGK
jgi:hypothetical protein